MRHANRVHLDRHDFSRRSKPTPDPSFLIHTLIVSCLLAAIIAAGIAYLGAV